MGIHRNPWGILVADTRAVLPTILKADTQSAGLWVRNPTASPHAQIDLLSGEIDVAVHAGQTNPETSKGLII